MGIDNGSCEASFFLQKKYKLFLLLKISPLQNGTFQLYCDYRKRLQVKRKE